MITNNKDTNDKVIGEDLLSDISLAPQLRGVLLKWTQIINGELYYYKSGKIKNGIFTNYEPVNECIASEIGQVLGVNCVKYDLAKIHVSKTFQYKEQDLLVCRSKSFLGKDEIFLSIYELYNSNTRSICNTYKCLLKKFPWIEESLNSMLIFDFIINNRDRHFNNFGFVQDKDHRIIDMTKIFDNGSSLYSNLGKKEIRYILQVKNGYKKFDRAKPFKKTHMEQIKIIENLPHINLDFNDDIIKEIVMKYSQYLERDRVNAILQLLYRQIRYVKNLYFYNQN